MIFNLFTRVLFSIAFACSSFACTEFAVSDLDFTEGGLLGLLVASSVTSTGTNAYVGVGNTGQNYYTTAPAGTWLSFGTPITDTLQKVAYGNGVFVSGATTHTNIYWSSNGYAWNKVTAALGTGGLVTVAFGNDVFVGGGTGGRMYTSSDGKSWSAFLLGGIDFARVIYDGARFIAMDIGAPPVLYTSTTGAAGTWSNISTTGIAGVARFRLLYESGQYYMDDGAGGNALTSADGTNWVVATGPGYIVTNYGSGNGLIIAPHQPGGTGSFRVAGVDAWTTFTTFPGAPVMNSVIYDGTYYIMGGLLTTPQIYYSTDGSNWTQNGSSMTGANGFNHLAFGAVD